jgi:uncharacterized protein YhbP (UPF0306 family)
MTQEIINFINSQRICVIAFEMLDGSPHASTVHFAFDPISSVFFFETNNTYRKGEVLLGKPAVRSSVVVGFDERNMKTLQLDGEARLIKAEEKKLFNEIYLGKFPEKKEKFLDPKFVFFSFTSKWWRYTDWENPAGKIILSSEDKI